MTNLANYAGKTGDQLTQSETYTLAMELNRKQIGLSDLADINFMVPLFDDDAMQAALNKSYKNLTYEQLNGTHETHRTDLLDLYKDITGLATRIMRAAISDGILNGLEDKTPAPKQNNVYDEDTGLRLGKYYVVMRTKAESWYRIVKHVVFTEDFKPPTAIPERKLPEYVNLYGRKVPSDWRTVTSILGICSAAAKMPFVDALREVEYDRYYSGLGTPWFVSHHVGRNHVPSLLKAMPEEGLAVFMQGAGPKEVTLDLASLPAELLEAVDSMSASLRLTERPVNYGQSMGSAATRPNGDCMTVLRRNHDRRAPNAGLGLVWGLDASFPEPIKAAYGGYNRKAVANVCVPRRRDDQFGFNVNLTDTSGRTPPHLVELGVPVEEVKQYLEQLEITPEMLTSTGLCYQRENGAIEVSVCGRNATQVRSSVIVNKVWTTNSDYRVAVLIPLMNIGKTYAEQSLSVLPEVVIVPPEHPLWRDLDEGHLLVPGWSNVVDDFERTPKVLYEISRKLGRALLEVPPRINKSWVRRNILPDMRKAELAANTAKMMELKAERLQSKFSDVALGKRESIKYNNVTYTANSIEFQDTKVLVEGNYMVPFLASLTPNLLDDQEFNAIVKSMVASVGSLDINKGDPLGEIVWKHEDEESEVPQELPYGITPERSLILHIGEVRCEIASSLTAAGHVRMSVNGIRINKKEVVEVVVRAMCFQDTESFNKFLNNVSRCSIKIMDYMTNGIEVSLTNPLLGSISTALVKMRRKRGKNYLLVPNGETDDHGAEKYDEVPISGINKLIGCARGRYSIRRFKAVLDTTAPVTDAQYRTLVQSSIRNYLKAVKKSEELLEDTKKLFKVELVDNPWNDNRERTGIARNHATVSVRGGKFWKVPAKSGAVYYIRDDESLPIFSERGNHICIVDKSSAQMNATVGRDALVARIYAVALDTHTVQSVSTLRHHMGKKAA